MEQASEHKLCEGILELPLLQIRVRGDRSEAWREAISTNDRRPLPGAQGIRIHTPMPWRKFLILYFISFYYPTWMLAFCLPPCTHLAYFSDVSFLNNPLLHSKPTPPPPPQPPAQKRDTAEKVECLVIIFFYRMVVTAIPRLAK